MKDEQRQFDSIKKAYNEQYVSADPSAGWMDLEEKLDQKDRKPFLYWPYVLGVLVLIGFLAILGGQYLTPKNVTPSTTEANQSGIALQTRTNQEEVADTDTSDIQSELNESIRKTQSQDLSSRTHNKNPRANLNERISINKQSVIISEIASIEDVKDNTQNRRVAKPELGKESSRALSNTSHLPSIKQTLIKWDKSDDELFHPYEEFEGIQPSGALSFSLVTQAGIGELDQRDIVLSDTRHIGLSLETVWSDALFASIGVNYWRSNFNTFLNSRVLGVRSINLNEYSGSIRYTDTSSDWLDVSLGLNAWILGYKKWRIYGGIGALKRWTLSHRTDYVIEGDPDISVIQRINEEYPEYPVYGFLTTGVNYTMCHKFDARFSVFYQHPLESKSAQNLKVRGAQMSLIYKL